VVGVTDGDAQYLVAVCGLPGVGKSTVAEYVTEQVDGTRLRTDVIRKELFDEPTYSESETNRVYEELHDRTRDRLERGDSAVLDATFANSRHREPLGAIARDYDAELRLTQVVCDDAAVERRIARRDDISDADVEVYRQFKELFDPVNGDAVTVDNSGSLDDTREQVDALF